MNDMRTIKADSYCSHFFCFLYKIFMIHLYAFTIGNGGHKDGSNFENRKLMQAI